MSTKSIEGIEAAAVRILLVDDDPEDTERYRRFLHSDRERRYTLSQAANIETATTLLHKERFDCVFLDQHLPMKPLLDHVESLTHSADADDVPVIVVAGQGKELAIESLRRGATDYIRRDRLSSAICTHAISNAIEKATLRRTIKEQTANLRVVTDTVQTQSSEISNFYHTVAHEIRTPLTAAREFIALVLDGVAGELNPKQQEILSHALDSCDDLSFIFSDLIESARLETGKVTLRRNPESLQKIIRRCVIAARPSIKAKQLQLEELTDDTIPPLELDATRMVQVISNLLGNAIKFTPQGGRITILTRLSRSCREVVEVRVTDTGCGIPDAEQQRIFERLYQAKVEGEELLGSGLGLGLSVAKDIVELHGGTIGVHSLVGVGSTFFVRLPLAGKAEGDQ